MSADYTRVHRLLRILTLIQGRDDWSAARLAAECGVAERTIYRDMKALEGAGIPYHYDEQTRGYRVRRDFFMPPVELTLDEALALIALGERIGKDEQIPLMRPASRAMAKLRSFLPASIRRDVEAVEPHLAIQLPPGGPHEGVDDVYDRIRTAIATGKALRCQYESVERSLKGDAAEPEAPFRFEPYVLYFCQRAWYSIGYHAGRGQRRCLKLNRFTSIELTDDSYRIPEDFSLTEHLGNAWRMIRGEPAWDVELHFDACFAETIADTQWHATQQIDWHDDDSITFRCAVDGLDEICWWVLSMGPHCIVRQPVELAERVRDLAERTAAHYPSPAATNTQ